ncbi:YfbU family protein [Agromyces sp. SYSU K20354]|uniref:YfbU family protein n=1 Tax=Agromyces cavernae TaxID=2898659 RepID=UPI001E4D5368|nr:YfbU family protein [Agromyces cavernae]MCD2443707.1 YfbU family protein [Agromyces cavernae]
MATINIRVEEHIRDALQEMADARGITLSDYVRDLLREATVSIRTTPTTGSGLAPDTLSVIDRQTLALLHRILARVLPEDANDVDGDLAYQLERAKALEEGYSGEYGMEFIGIRTELSPLNSERVKDILDMFRIFDYSIAAAAEAGESLEDETIRALRYQGFDFNDPLEAQMADYVEYLVNDGKWEERKEFLEGATHGNSHMPTLDMYNQMLASYRRIKDSRPRPRLTRDSYLLSRAELISIVERVR